MPEAQADWGLPSRFPDAARAQVYGDALELVGNTPLVRINRLAPDAKAEIWVKLDQYNLGGSSKDRIGINIVREAIASGELKPGQRIVDFGMGNTVIGLAIAGLATGHPVTLVAAPILTAEKRRLLELLGADFIPGRGDVPRDSPEHWEAVAARYEDEDPANWWSRQGSIPYNPAAHVESTGPEIWQQTQGRITHFIAAAMTGGTVSGTGRYLKGLKPGIEVTATLFPPIAQGTNILPVFRREPGWEELEHDWPVNIDISVLDAIETRPQADVIDFGWHVARTEGLVLGISSILSLLVAVEKARDAQEGDVIVVFSADSGRDYLTREYSGEWLRANDLAHVAEKHGA
ncbi:MAG TPA: cysteine synthase family protein [Microbacteriaceae bacterium]|nr:cysteine synthase family protein [Microbacteriaceae bacterium]